MQAIFVTLNVKPEERERFLQAAEDDSICSPRDEKGCLQFRCSRTRTIPIASTSSRSIATRRPFSPPADAALHSLASRGGRGAGGAKLAVSMTTVFPMRGERLGLRGQFRMGNTFGELFRVTTFGESHGGGVGVVVDGCPPRLPIDVEAIQRDLDRRRPGQSKLTTQRAETDTVQIYSGVFRGQSRARRS